MSKTLSRGYLPFFRLQATARREPSKADAGVIDLFRPQGDAKKGLTRRQKSDAKQGLVGSFAAKRVNQCGRSVISPAADVSIEFIEVPRSMRPIKPERVTAWNRERCQELLDRSIRAARGLPERDEPPIKQPVGRPSRGAPAMEAEGGFDGPTAFGCKEPVQRWGEGIGGGGDWEAGEGSEGGNAAAHEWKEPAEGSQNGTGWGGGTGRGDVCKLGGREEPVQEPMENDGGSGWAAESWEEEGERKAAPEKEVGREKRNGTEDSGEGRTGTLHREEGTGWGNGVSGSNGNGGGSAWGAVGGNRERNEGAQCKDIRESKTEIMADRIGATGWGGGVDGNDEQAFNKGTGDVAGETQRNAPEARVRVVETPGTQEVGGEERSKLPQDEGFSGKQKERLNNIVRPFDGQVVFVLSSAKGTRQMVEYLEPSDEPSEHPANQCKLEVGDVIERLLEDGDCVVANRQPSLHRHNVLAFLVKLTDAQTIGLPPQVCYPFNGDFDGDEVRMIDYKVAAPLR